MLRWCLGVICGVFVLAAEADGALAGGYEVELVNVRTLGHAHAGKAAVANDASTLYFNPAGMTRLRRNTLTGSLLALEVDADWTDAGSTDATGMPTSGPVMTNGASLEPGANLYAAFRLGRKWWAGVGVTVPYGLGTDYGEAWRGRYFATESRVLTLNVNPSVAYRINRVFSVGAGLAIQYASGTLSNMIDFGTIGFGLGIPGLTPQSADGRLKFTGDDIALGWNIGILIEPTCCTRFGIGYRSAIDQELRGDAEFRVPAAALPITAMGAFTDTKATAPLHTPNSLFVSGYHELSRRWAILADFTWQQWSKVQSFDLRFDNPAQMPVTVPANWEDTVHVTAGVIYTPNPCWTFRGGIGYETSPVPDGTREPRVPDTDRWWFSAGASKKLNRNLSLDFVYTYIHYAQGPVDVTNPLLGNVVGNLDWTAHIFGVGINWEF